MSKILVAYVIVTLFTPYAFCQAKPPVGFILTGAPAAGKSSILRGLEANGEFVIHEAARDVFLYQQVALQNPEPWLLPDSQESITKLQILRESRAPVDSRYFLDRSVIDGAAYLMLRPYSASIQASSLISQAGIDRYNSRVFLVLSQNEIKGPGERDGVIESSRAIEDNLRLVYTRLGYHVIDVPLSRSRSEQW